MTNKILVATVTYDGMGYCDEKFFGAILNLSGEFNVLVVDNSLDEKYSEGLRERFGVEVVWDGEGGRAIEKLIRGRNRILDYAVDKGYDYVMMFDADVIAPVDTLVRLLGCERDLVSGIYYNYFNVGGGVRWMPVAWAGFSEEEFAEIGRVRPDLVEGKTREDMKRYLSEDEISSGELMEVLYPSAGCMLISRKVFEKARYGQEEGSSTGDDIYFVNRARELGFEPYCFTKVKCEHLVLEKYKKDENGNLVYRDFVE
jgi:GT2 family glycosyltransferase